MGRQNVKAANENEAGSGKRRPPQLTANEETITDLVSTYKPVIRACCRFYHLPDDRIEDLTHDVFLAAYKSLSHYRGHNKLSTWLWSIARHRIIDQIRRESTHRRIEKTIDEHPPLIETREPAELAQKKELYHVLRHAIEMLPHAWMKVVKLYYWHQEDTEQIAKRMQIKPGSVRVILHRSRNRLREDLMSVLGQPNAAFAAVRK